MSGGQPEPGPRPPLLHRVTPEQLKAIDVCLAAVLVFVMASHVMRLQQANRPVELFALFLVGMSLAIRRWVPIPALALASAGIALAAALHQAWAEPFIAVPMYQVASDSDRSKSIPALVLASVVIVAPSIRHLAYNRSAAALGVVAATAAWFVGDSVRVRRVYVAGLAEQAAQRQREVLERAQRSVAEERLQIARELHDVVAHSLSVIAVQSGVGRHVIETQPGEAKKALAAIEVTSRDTLTELRRMLGVLRRDDGVSAALVPAPGIAALDHLVEQVRLAGYTVNLDAAAVAARPLSPTVELTIYRIAQEALTNVVKHAGPATVNIQIRDEPSALVLEVNDDGRGAETAIVPAQREGLEAHHGIIGMRERVAIFHGSLLAAPRPEGGFRVVAKFPVESLSA
ncbi:MAG: sensor histidine kinase [Acidimicrobiales bacterium]